MQHPHDLGHGGGGEIRQLTGLLLVPPGGETLGGGSPAELLKLWGIDADESSLDDPRLDRREPHRGCASRES